MSDLSNSVDAINLGSRRLNTELSEIELSVPDIHCAGCIRTIENTLVDAPGVNYARVNLTTRRVRIRWYNAQDTPALIPLIEKAGYKAYVPESHSTTTDNNDELKHHIRALAVAGFAAGNVMMLSLSVWSGADEQTRHLFHMASGFIALPALIFSSRIFFSSAWRALRVGRTNMDVPICVGIVVTTILSLYDTTTGGHQVYFDAAITLVFLLLIGRTLETRMRARARSTIDDFAKLQPALARIVSDDEQQLVNISVERVNRGDLLHIHQNERVPVDCKVLTGCSSIDKSMISGESSPVRVVEGDVLYSGCLNLEGELRAVAIESVKDSFLARIEQQIEEASAQKGRYLQMADKVVNYYTPFVHLAALSGFLLWMWRGADWYQSITVGVTVLIITCPCALGLAVPIARVIAAHQLVKHGVLMKDGSALERLALISKVIFDKTGTLTTGKPQICVSASNFDAQTLSTAQTLCRDAEHPYARAIARYKPQQAVSTQAKEFTHWTEVPGDGITGTVHSDVYRLGRSGWASNTLHSPTPLAKHEIDGSILSKNGIRLARFTFEDSLNTQAADCINSLRNQGLSVELLSGDALEKVRRIAGALNINKFKANARPDDKLAQIKSYQSGGKHVLMVGDGINDSPALAAAAVSIVPGTGADMTRKMADFVLLNDHLTAIPKAIAIAQQARRIVAQNLVLAVGYNVVALPLAISGAVTPLIAAIAMSLSSVLVIANSLRLGAGIKSPVTHIVWHQSDMAIQQ